MICQIYCSNNRSFNTTELRKRRRRAEAKWTVGFDSEEDEKCAMDTLYSAYHSQTARNFFVGNGLLDQGKDILCRTLRNAVLGGTWCHISHKCHWAVCLNVSHLEQVVMRTITDDRTACKNRSQANDGGCNALYSLHPHDHCLCLLDNPHGAAFDDQLPLRLPAPLGQKKKIQSPCVNGCTTTWGGGWDRDLGDKTTPTTSIY